MWLGQKLAAVEAAIMAFNRPLIEATVYGLLRCSQPLIYDFDLTSQAVRPTRTSYPEAAFKSLRTNNHIRLSCPHLAVGRVSVGAVLPAATNRRPPVAKRRGLATKSLLAPKYPYYLSRLTPQSPKDNEKPNETHKRIGCHEERIT
jgi:hypothetical protein